MAHQVQMNEELLCGISSSSFKSMHSSFNSSSSSSNSFWCSASLTLLFHKTTLPVLPILLTPQPPSITSAHHSSSTTSQHHLFYNLSSPYRLTRHSIITLRHLPFGLLHTQSLSPSLLQFWPSLPLSLSPSSGLITSCHVP